MERNRETTTSKTEYLKSLNLHRVRYLLAHGPDHALTLRTRAHFLVAEHEMVFVVLDWPRRFGLMIQFLITLLDVERGLRSTTQPVPGALAGAQVRSQVPIVESSLAGRGQSDLAVLGWCVTEYRNGAKV